MKKNGTFLVVIIWIMFIFILPFLTFWLGYLDGIIIKFVIGDIFCKGINTIFKIDIVKDQLPLIVGTITMIVVSISALWHYTSLKVNVNS